MSDVKRTGKTGKSPAPKNKKMGADKTNRRTGPMTDPNRPEKRKFPRLEGLTLPIEYALKGKAGPSFKQAKATSLGESGFLIGSQDRLSLGAALNVKLYLPKTLFPFSDWQSIMTEAKVVRADKTPGSEFEFHYGIFITNISPQGAVYLKNYLASSNWREKSSGS